MKKSKKKKKDSVKVDFSYASPTDPFLKKLAIRALELTTGRKKLERFYEEILATNPEPIEIWGATLKKLKIDLSFDQQQIEKIPRKGPIVFIANHPFGVVDGLALGYLVSQTRKDFTVIVNEVLCREEKLSQYLLPVDFRESKEAMQINLDTRKQSMEKLKNGEAIAIFPAGGVATSKGLKKKAEDLEWKRFVAKMIHMTGATVVPIFVHGQNSRLFQLVSQVSLTLRLGLLMNEVRNKMGKEIRFEIGDPIDPEVTANIKNRQELLDYLKEKTFALAQ